VSDTRDPAAVADKVNRGKRRGRPFWEGPSCARPMAPAEGAHWVVLPCWPAALAISNVLNDCA